MEQTRNIRIGDVLKQYGYATDAQIDEALSYQKSHTDMRLGDALIAMGVITERQMLEALASRFSMPLIDIADVLVDVNIVMLLPRKLAEKNHLLAVNADRAKATVTVVTSDPTNFYAFDDVRQLTGMYVEVELCEESSLEKAITYYYAEVDARRAASRANEEIKESVQLIETGDGDETPVINLVDSLLRRAYSTGASDIHVEPFENETHIRMRVDGVINDFVTIAKSIHASLIARIKILSDMDIAEKRIPQDGHFRFDIDGYRINVRVSMIPTVFGEKAVIRLLAPNTMIVNDDTFGMMPEDYREVSRMLQAPHGIIYLTGPTGSGKSTTLYKILEALAQRQVNISTIEDPVEKNVPRLNQMQVNNQSGLSFDVGLRALLRQDPDIIMVGETRDSETASISVRAAITGHLVLSTLHTNDAASAVVRLIDMGVAPYLIASSLNGVIAQRLVRKLCPLCAEEVNATADEKAFLGENVEKVKRPKGCHMCNFTGYRGRFAIHEILTVDKEMRAMIVNGASTDEIRAYACSQNMKLLKTRGVEIVKRGITSVEELMKVAYGT